MAAWIVIHFASGAAWFSGLTLVAAAALIAALERPRLAVAARSLAVVGLVVALASATPALGWLAAVLIVTTLWIAGESARLRPRVGPRGLRALRCSLVASAALATAVEVPYHLSPAIPRREHPLLYVIGDSITAGMGRGEETWPRWLARRAVVVDAALAGATVKTALRLADLVTEPDALVLVEIGGNDLLGTTTDAEFEAGLDQLLARLVGPRRTVVMLGLPLPPHRHAVGYAQRRLAERHGVHLLPRRVLMNVVGQEDATLDGLHLSNSGHEQLAAAISAELGDLLAKVDVPGASATTIEVIVDDSGRASIDGRALDDVAFLHTLARSCAGRPGREVVLRFTTSQVRRAADLSRLVRAASARVRVDAPDETE